MNIEVMVNQACNAVCQHCNRGVGVIHYPLTMTRDVMKRGVDQMIEAGLNVGRITITGGEPLVNPNLQGIIDECDRVETLIDGLVYTNSVIQGPRRDAIKLPSRWRWVDVPLDDLSNPYSGKRGHRPFFVSPADDGMQASWKKCVQRRRCGIGFDRSGWTMCPVAGTLGRMLRINPYWSEPSTRKRKESICKHCVLGLTRGEYMQLRTRHTNQKDDGISKTFWAGIEKFIEDPIVFDDY